MKAVAVTASAVNAAHRKAIGAAEDAVAAAIECGRLLLAKKEELDRGQFDGWLDQWAEMGRSTAYRYMKAAKEDAKGVAFDAVRHIFPSARPGVEKPRNHAAAAEIATQSSTAVDDSTVQQASPAANSAPAETPISPREEPWQERPKSAGDAGAPADNDPPAWSDADEAAAHSEFIAAQQESISRWADSDDRAAALLAENDRLLRLVQAQKGSIDSLLGAKAAAVQQAKVEQRRVAKLEAKLRAAEAENERLRERIAVMESA